MDGGKYSSGENIRRGKIFVGEKYSSGKNIRRGNISSGKYFVNCRKFRQFFPTDFPPIIPPPPPPLGAYSAPRTPNWVAHSLRSFDLDDLRSSKLNFQNHNGPNTKCLDEPLYIYIYIYILFFLFFSYFFLFPGDNIKPVCYF